MRDADLTEDEVKAAALAFKASMWDKWAAINDRIAAELPVRYEITYSLRRFDFAVLLWRGDEMVPYPDPPDLDRNGSVFQILEAALEAAKAHDKENPS